MENKKNSSAKHNKVKIIQVCFLPIIFKQLNSTVFDKFNI